MPERTWWLLALFEACSILEVGGHGRMLVPPSRPSAWRLGFTAPINYNDNQQNCGGREVHRQNGYRCGVCGDPWMPVPRPHERPEGAKVMDEDFILSSYSTGEVITASIQITASHLGYFQFFLCNVDELSPPVEATEECLRRHLLVVVNTKGVTKDSERENTRYTNITKGTHHINLQLPPGLVCHHCVLQWKYTAGNDWNDGCKGCGHQELFLSCADISISSPDGSLPLPPSPTPSSTPTPTLPSSSVAATTLHPFHYVPEPLRPSLSPGADRAPGSKEMLRFFLCTYCAQRLLLDGDRWPRICLARVLAFGACSRTLC